MKKIFFSKVLALGIAFSAISSIGVNAAINESTGLDLNVKAGEIEKPEVDPPGGNNGGPGNGSTSFQFWLWPSNISFNDLSVSTENQEISAKENLDRYLAVGDLRGTSAGYRVTASMSQPEDSNSGEKLVGAKLKWSQEAVKFLKPAVDYSNEKDNSELTLNDSNIELGSEETLLYSALKNKGQGYYGIKIMPTSLKLKVPGNQGKAGNNYKSTVTWTLNDTPQP